nr:ATP-binding cassette domain-containing protein [Bacilli bacterium]
MRVEMEKVSMVIRGHQILNAIDAQMEDGVHVVVGKNGSGKTSILKMVSGIWKPTSGMIHYDGSRHVPHATLGYLIDPPSFYETFTAAEMLHYYVNMAGKRWDAKYYENHLKKWSVPAGKIKTFSRGQRQRLGIVCSYWHDPSLWLLDEPFTGLDRSGASFLWDTIFQQVKATGCTVIVVLHDGHGLPADVKQVIEVQQANLTFQGKANEFFAHSLQKVNGMVPLHWQPVLDAHAISFSYREGKLQLLSALDDPVLADALLEAKLNPLTLMEEERNVEV